MKKAECEKNIRRLVHDWRVLRGIEIGSAEMPSFSDFCSWLRSSGHSQLLEFRSAMGPLEDAERWFDAELKQSWRN
jgi:hypothetical protein